MNSIWLQQEDRVSAAFRRIVGSMTLTASDQEAFEAHKARVQRSLGASFNVAKYLAMGSYARGSAARGSSDLDLLVVLRRGDICWGETLKSSTTVLNSVRDALRCTFPNTDLGRDAQAIVLHFADGRDVDVVPGWWRGTLSDNWPLYMIPDGEGGWMPTAPDTHARYILAGDTASGGKLKSVVKLLKFWKQSRALPLPLTTFHLELLLTVEGLCAPGKTFSACTAEALNLLARRECRALQDPCRVSGLIHAAGSEAKRGRLLAAVRDSAQYAATARAAEAVGNTNQAAHYWALVFNGEFS